MTSLKLPIDDLLKEIELRTLYRARAVDPGNTAPLDVHTITEAEHDLVKEQLREAVVDIRLILETFMPTEEPFEFNEEGGYVRFDITLPERWNESKMDVFCLLVKNYLMHATLARWYASIGHNDAALVEESLAEKKAHDIRVYKTKKDVRKTYTFI